MVLTFLAISIFAFIVFGSSIIIKHFESKPQVTAFFKDTAQQQNIDDLEQSLRSSGKVSKMRYVSKSEALQIYREQNKDDQLLLDLVTQDILPASLEVSTYQIEDLGSVYTTLKNSPYVQTVSFQKDIVASLATWTNAIRIIGIAVIILLVAVSIFILMTVIGFKVSQKREEIEIMKLLSATNWYIRWPFIMEGIIYGVVGTLIGWGIASFGLLYATPYLQTFLHGILSLPVSPVFLVELLTGELFIAILLGMLASSLAVLRYLK
jgi:cell division transport system permease protein